MTRAIAGRDGVVSGEASSEKSALEGAAQAAGAAAAVLANAPPSPRALAAEVHSPPQPAPAPRERVEPSFVELFKSVEEMEAALKGLEASIRIGELAEKSVPGFTHPSLVEVRTQHRDLEAAIRKARGTQASTASPPADA